MVKRKLMKNIKLDQNIWF